MDDNSVQSSLVLLIHSNRFGYEYVGSKDRLIQPLIKRNGNFQTAGWDEALDLKYGARVKVASRQGEIATRLKTSTEVLPGEIFMPFHYSEFPVNELTRDELDPDSKIAPFKWMACRVKAF